MIRLLKEKIEKEKNSPLREFTISEIPVGLIENMETENSENSEFPVFSKSQGVPLFTFVVRHSLGSMNKFKNSARRVCGANLYWSLVVVHLPSGTIT